MKKVLVLLLALCLALPYAAAADAVVENVFTVQTEELVNGDFSLTACGMKLTFTPIDVRFCLTRESSRYLFNRMGFQQETILESMEAYDIYAMLYDRNQRACVQVHLYRDAEERNYAAAEDWRITTGEQLDLIRYGWMVQECDVVALEGLKLVRIRASHMKADGSKEFRLVYRTYEAGVCMEIQTLASGERIIDMVAEQVDAFVRGIRVEKIEQMRLDELA